jgi:tripartite-type tricarboxylate transporter receptor subunit TctC
MTTPITILPMVTKNPGFAPATDFMPVAGFATFVNAFAVSGGTPAKSFNEYVNWVRTQGNGKGSVGVPAPASTPEFLVKVIGEKYKLDLVAAPYRGSAPMMADMLGNQIAAGVASVPDFIENHKAGKVRVVGVLGDKRQAAMPDVPTFAELGLAGFEDMPYYGIFAPAGTPKATVDQFSAAVAKAIAMPEVREKLTAMGLTVGYMTPQQLAAREQGLCPGLGAHHQEQRFPAAVMDSGPLALQDLAHIRRQLRALGAGPGHEQRVLRLWAQALPQGQWTSAAGGLSARRVAHRVAGGG